MLIPSASEKQAAMPQQQVASGRASNFSQVLEQAKSDVATQTSTASGKVDLSNLTTEQASDLLIGMLRNGTLSLEEYQTISPTVMLRDINEQLGYSQPARFDLFSGVQSLIENSKMIGRYDQVRAQAHGLQILKAYQTNQ
ncbi:hypothetical protein [Chromobacterium subtsugae]|uniref:hypothetical protein n=1 Tax=Chromobacterium subtsugae TaxID=251747 RepID=UPI00128B5BB4|nr:hypothetical protein [Chromobacterium subtsugae]